MKRTVADIFKDALALPAHAGEALASRLRELDSAVEDHPIQFVRARRRALKRLRSGLDLQWTPASSRDELRRRCNGSRVQLRDVADPDTGERYTMKRYESLKAAKGDSWRHDQITLKPVNPDFKPIMLTDTRAGELQVIAEHVEVIKTIDWSG
jgi:hypothetical protein